ncbi:oxygenase MpaB family protein [Amycolatopsis cynarae]|uniref:Oxygenase MpaB family protein n=1 Tax=Amycolatopsis cynarae TaxID=2995223 RepID=A0ABY7ATA6_9PSEU|nr:oxygenase MpaB family protein [Amycolatopsis sp. HUAS 11-8]WAL63182.1 oxygenase MpaB family protein [Amycolatopsis sp. HUAS 11-8]
MTVADSRSAKLDETMLGAGLLAGAANVIMQLAHPGVGYGVVESRVASGRLFDHPVKRTRTTLTYLAVAVLGTDEERKAYRKAVNKQHAQVRSTASSPVRYNAFDPELQLWVAACLYRGFEDTCTVFLGPFDEQTLEEVYRASATLGTTLQVREEMWPADRAAFEEYWHAALEKVSIDDTVREHLYDIATLKFLPAPVRAPFAHFNLFVTTGFLPPRFREEMRLSWSPRRQERFDRLMRVIGTAARNSPRVVREFPYNFYLWDLRRRLAAGRPLV